jgi:hypothetical protein
MKHEELVLELQDVVRQLGITVRFDQGNFEGGYCILKAQKLLLINRRLVPVRKASVLAAALREIGLENVFLKPAIRAYIEDETARMGKATS